MTVRCAPQLQRPLHLLLKGDKPLANRWIPWAKKKLHTLERYHVGFSGYSFGSMAYRVEHNTERRVTVFIKATKDQKMILIEAIRLFPALYMESGILDHRNFAPLNEDTYLPSILHYSNAIKTIRQDHAELGELEIKEASPLLLDGENRGEGDSKAIGCKKKDKKRVIIATSPFGDTRFQSNVAKFCDDLKDRKTVQTQMPPSLWSGKLRLMIQSVYGSKREDYKMDELFGNFSPLELDGETISYNFNGGVGLFSGRNHEYFMVKVQSAGIYAKALKPSTSGEELREYLNDNPGIPAARKKRYEAYLLSTLTFKGSWVRIGEVNDIFAHGGTFGYGLAWNWSGDTAYAATHNLKSGTTNVWEACLMRVAVAERTAETLAEGRLTAVGVLEEGPTEFTFSVASDLIWTPDFLLGGMNLFVSQSDAFDGPTHVDSDVPIHAMTNYENDTFDLVRFKREDKGSGDHAFGGSNSSAGSVQDATLGCSDGDCRMFSTATGSVVEKGFYVARIGGAKYEFFEAVNESGNGVVAHATEVIRGGAFHSFLNPTFSPTEGVHDPCGEAPPDATHDKEVNGTASGGDLGVDGDFSGKYMLLIPFYDCDAVYIGSFWEFDGDVDTEKADAWSANAWNYYKDLGGGNFELVKEMGRAGGRWHPDAGTPIALKESVRVQALNAGILSQADGDTIFTMLRLEYFFNGAFVEVHVDEKVEDGGIAGAMFYPSCWGGFPVEEPPEWETGSTNFGGYSVHWNPNPIFPVPVKAQAVFSRTSGIDHSYKITKDPGDTWLDDGDYDYDQIDDTIFSYVGFA